MRRNSIVMLALLFVLCVPAIASADHKTLKEFERLFEKNLQSELSLHPSSEIFRHEFRDEELLQFRTRPFTEGLRYKNDLSLEERAFYRASADFLNNLRWVRMISEKLEHFSRLEVGLVTDSTVAVDPRLTPLEIPPKAPDPKVEVRFGEQKEKWFRLGVKLSGSGNLLGTKYVVSPLVYSRAELKLATLQVRFSAVDQNMLFEASANRSVLGMRPGASYDMNSSQTNLMFSRRLFGQNELRFTSGFNAASGDWGVYVLLFSLITF